MQVETVQPPLQFIPPTFSPWIFRLTQYAIPFWLPHCSRIQHVQVERIDRLVQLYHQFQQGKTRFLIAFRHSTLDDAFCLHYLFTHLLPRSANQQGVSLQQPCYVHFLYDRGVPLWAGRPVGWLLSRLGATPIRRSKLDRQGVRSARALFAQGLFPLAVAPEGIINGHTERLGPLEPGAAQLSFWCMEDLYRVGRLEQVVVLPIGIHYRYIQPPWRSLNRLLSQLEADCGLSMGEKGNPEFMSNQAEWFCHRLQRLSDRLLSEMEAFYTRFYHRSLPSEASLSNRLQALVDAALSVAEQAFGLQPSGDRLARRHRIEQAAWARIYRDDLPSCTMLSPFERGIADRVAREASCNLWHMQWAESFLTVNEQYLLEKPSVERIADMTLLLWDCVTRIKGGNAIQRPHLGPRLAHITIGEPLTGADRWDAYQANRQAAVTELTRALQMALKDLIPQQPDAEFVEVPLVGHFYPLPETAEYFN